MEMFSWYLNHQQYYIMDIFASTSRGNGLDLPNHHLMPSAFITELVDAALCKDNKRRLRNSGGTNFIYIIGGLPDTTTKITDYRYRYQEVIFCDSPTKKYQEIVSTYLDANYAIRSVGAIPVFSTITTMNLNDWNCYRYFQRKTSYLIHSPYYDDMQYNLNATLEIVNRQIFEINNGNLVETPHFANSVTTKRGEGQGFRVRYSRLADGVHPVDDVIQEWRTSLRWVASVNRERHS